MRRVRLGAFLLVGLVACGPGATDSVSSTGPPAPAEAGAGRGQPSFEAVDDAALTARWRVVKTTSESSPFDAGEVVEFRAGGAVATGPDLGTASLMWGLDGDRLQLLTPGGSVTYTAALRDDMLRLRDGQGRTDLLRRFDGPAQPVPPATAVLAEAEFLSMLGRGLVESATLTQTGSTIAVTGVYVGGASAERYSVTLQRCDRIRGLAATFRAHGVLTDGMLPSDADC